DHTNPSKLALYVKQIYAESQAVSELTTILCMRRPLQTVIGVALVLVLLIFQAWDVLGTPLDWDGLRSEGTDYSSDIAALRDDMATRIAAGGLAGLSLLIGCLQVIASPAVCRGSTRSRLWVLAPAPTTGIGS